jgi:hypothetical protein
MQPRTTDRGGASAKSCRGETPTPKRTPLQSPASPILHRSNRRSSRRCSARAALRIRRLARRSSKTKSFGDGSRGILTGLIRTGASSHPSVPVAMRRTGYRLPRRVPSMTPALPLRSGREARPSSRTTRPGGSRTESSSQAEAHSRSASERQPASSSVRASAGGMPGMHLGGKGWK